MDIHEALQPLDFAVIVVYLIVLLGIGAWVSFHSKGAQVRAPLASLRSRQRRR